MEDIQPPEYSTVPICEESAFSAEVERADVADANPEDLAKMLVLVEQARVELGDSLSQRVGRENRSPGLSAE